MKQISILFFTAILYQSAFAQEKTEGFDWNKVFAGGSIVLGYSGGNASSSNFTIGGNPEIGYSIFKSVDIGLGFNIVNQSGNYYDNNIPGTVKYNIFQSGAGMFLRLHITDGFFINLQPEFSTIKYKASATNGASLDDKVTPTSFLAGIGYGTRDVGNANFFTLILVDLQKNLYSPYRNSAGQIIPQIRGGINFYFNRKKKNN